MKYHKVTVVKNQKALSLKKIIQKQHQSFNKFI